jgi:hypothetical protein
VPDVGKIVAGAALIAGAVALDVATGGAAFAAGAEEFTAFLAIGGSTGAGLALSGVEGLIATPPPGQGVTSQNPIAPWQISYGQVKVGGTVVYLEDNGGILSNGSNTYDKCHNRVVMVAAHPIKSVDQVRMNGKTIPLGPGGSGAQSTTWTFTPDTNQNQTNIASIHRASGVVTIVLTAGISGQNGLQFNVQSVADNTFNGVFTVTQPNPADDTTFTYLCGGVDASASGGFILTCYPDYKNRIHCDLTSCLGNHSNTFPELVNNSALWTSAHRNLGKASVYLGFYYDADVFPGGSIPQSSFVISGKNDIYDPRLGDFTDPAAHVYTTNAALVIADYLTNQAWGYGLAYGTDVPLAQLIAAANICDEAIPLAVGGTEPRYTINMTFSLAQGRGAVLQDMLNACAGRLSILSGQFIIVPGAWVGPFLSLSKDNLVGPIEYKPIRTIRDICNGVKGTYTSPVNSWQTGDIPPYAEDTTHGFVSDQWLAADNGVRIWKDVSYPATTSCPTAQRIAKIDLERTRREGDLVLHCDMSAYTAVALDVVEFSWPRYGWVNKTFEVLSSALVVQVDQNGGAPTLGVDLELAEVDSDIYDWSTAEELTPADNPSPAINSGQIVSGPQTLIIESGPTTSYVGADGVALPRILASWETSNSANVQSGGYFDVQYQKVGDAFWTAAGRVPGTQNQCYITGVIAGQNYSVQVQAYNQGGSKSGWAQAGPITCSATSTFMSASNVTYPDGTPVGDLQPATAGADVTALQPIAYTGTSANLISNGTFLLGDIKGWGGTCVYLVGIHGPSVYLHALTKAISPTFNVTPGQKYRFSFTGFQSVAGTENVILRIFYGSLFAPTINDAPVPGYAGFQDFVNGGALTTSLDTYTYDWTCPSGVYFASLAMYQQGTAELSFTNVSARDFNASGEWGSDVTGNNTALAIVGQGTLATLNKTNTVNIVAGAVNSNIVYQSTTQVIVPATGTATIVGQATITTDGGYVKVSVTLNLGAAGTNYPNVTLYKGGIGGTILDQQLDVTVGFPGNASVALQAVDASPGLSQQYTVAVTGGFSFVNYCNSIALIIENAKV